jgi:hypothetical protein
MRSYGRLISNKLLIRPRIFLEFRKNNNLKRHNRNPNMKKYLIKNFDKIKKSNITNLSDYKLTNKEILILNKGLNFTFSSNNNNNYTIQRNIKNIDDFNRLMQIKQFFNKKKSNNNFNNYKKRLPIKSKWSPDTVSTEINSFTDELKIILRKMEKIKNKNNISSSEMKALMKLKNNTNIIIKPADKGGGIVVMNKLDYVQKMNEHLNSTTVYSLISDEEIKNKELIRNYFKILYELKQYLSRKQYRWLSDVKNETGTLYGLPKIHKNNIPIRPIISQMNSLTKKLHIYIQLLLLVAESKIPNLIKDSTDFLNKLDTFTDKINDNTFLVTLDVESLYTNIPTTLGIEWITQQYSETLYCWQKDSIDVKPIPTFLFKKILKFALENCLFNFNNKTYIQNNGLTMGGSSSVQAANIIMYKFFVNFNRLYPTLIFDHFRFIDDLFGIWNFEEIQLNYFLGVLNGYHNNFKFTINYSKTEISFLDILIFKTGNKLNTTIYTKPTDKKLYLSFDSNHPKHVLKAIPYSQFLRLKRIISIDEEYLKQLKNMEKKFIERGYPLSTLTSAREKIDNVNRDTLLTYKIRSNTSHNIILILEYENKFEKNNYLKKQINKKYKEFIEKNPDLEITFPNKPIIAYKNGPNIKSLLVKNKYPIPKKIPRKRYNIDAIDNINLENLLSLETEQDIYIF